MDTGTTTTTTTTSTPPLSSSSSTSTSAESTPELFNLPNSPTAFFKGLEPEDSSVQQDPPRLSSSASTSISTAARHAPRKSSGSASPPRAHFRSKDVMKFEGRDDVLQVWVCNNEPRSPLVTPTLEKQEMMEMERKGYTLSHHQHHSLKGHKPDSMTAITGHHQHPRLHQQQPPGLHLAHRPPFVHSETVPDVREEAFRIETVAPDRALLPQPAHAQSSCNLE